MADPEGDPGVHGNPPLDWIQRGIRGAQEPPLGLHLALVRLKTTPLFGYRTKNTAPMAHLRML